MKDLTRNSISIHLFTLTAPVMMLMLAQVAYQLIDLYFVASLGVDATAGVTAAGGAGFLVAALTQVLSVGITPLVAHAVGAKNRASANIAFNQGLLLSVLIGGVVVAAIAALTRTYMGFVAANRATADAGTVFLWWLLPSLAFVFPTATLASSLRATGIISPVIIIFTLTTLINAALAPVLVAGWGTGVALGVAGAGMATSVSAFFGLIFLFAYFYRRERYLDIVWHSMRPLLQIWRQVLRVGLPASAEVVLTFLGTTATYYVISRFGSATQAGYGVGSRVLQVVLLPGLAIGSAVVPIAAQNFGAKNLPRVRQTFHRAALITAAVMIAIAMAVQYWADVMVLIFSRDPTVNAVAARFLRTMAWVFVVQSWAYVCTGIFQGFGNTLPSLLSSGAQFATFIVPALLLSGRQELKVEHVWRLLAVSVVLQLLVSLWLLSTEFKRRLSETAPSNLQAAGKPISRTADAANT